MSESNTVRMLVQARSYYLPTVEQVAELKRAAYLLRLRLKLGRQARQEGQNAAQERAT